MSARLFQAITPTGMTDPMTAPELIEWALFHKMRFCYEPRAFNEFKVKACDCELLTKAEMAAFEKLNPKSEKQTYVNVCPDHPDGLYLPLE